MKLNNSILISLQDILIDYIRDNRWNDYRKYSNKLSKYILSKNPQNIDELKKVVEKFRHDFFDFNDISIKMFLEYLPKDEILNIVEKGMMDSLTTTKEVAPPLVLSDIFPEILKITPEEAEKHLDEIDIDERTIQDEFRSALREKRATNITRRKSDTSLEVADLEDFTLSIYGESRSFTAVVKGYKSLRKKSATLKEIMHQIVKANDTNPDYILVVLAKPPTDGVITRLVKYGADTGNRNLVIIVDPIDLIRFLRIRDFF